MDVTIYIFYITDIKAREGPKLHFNINFILMSMPFFPQLKFFFKY